MGHLERGLITGGLEGKLGRVVGTRQTRCRGLGDRVCEFEITADLDVQA